MTRRPTPPVTAILTCRNAEHTLQAVLDHFHANQVNVVFVDHGSTDETRTIATRNIGKSVTDIHDEPFDGTFDLGRQLRLKRDLIGQAQDGWIIHADADEFIDPPEGLTLSELAGELDDKDIMALECEERLYLPKTNLETHAPRSFQKTMKDYVILRERDPKQRMFRSSAPLKTWFKTAGHTVTQNKDQICDQILSLRHYLGLSLDEIRAVYLSRVFSWSEIAKLWHSTRTAHASFEVVEPPPGCLDLQGVENAYLPKLPPCFDLRPRPQPVCMKVRVDLRIHSESQDVGEKFIKCIRGIYADLRIGFWEEGAANTAPILCLLQHPVDAIEQSDTEPELRSRASQWVRHLALLRQQALVPSTRYGELRIEDLSAGKAELEQMVRKLLLGGVSGSEGFIKATVSSVERPIWPPVLKAITGPLARDLRYF